MKHNQETTIQPYSISSSKFGVRFENQFVVLDDAEHVIGIDASVGTQLIFENILNGSRVNIRGRCSHNNLIKTLLYDRKTGFLYYGDNRSHLHKYKVDTASKTCQRIKGYGNLWIGRIHSSYQFLNFVFIAGSNSKIRVLDLTTDEFLSEYLETSIRFIYSLHVYSKSLNEIYLAVSGGGTDYSDDKTDLFDVSRLFLNDPVILGKLSSEHSFNNYENILDQLSVIKSQAEKIKDLTKDKETYKAELNKIQSKYKKVKKKLLAFQLMEKAGNNYKIPIRGNTKPDRRKRLVQGRIHKKSTKY